MRLVVEVASYILNIRRAVYTVGYGHLVLTGKLICVITTFVMQVK